jgi:pimeloyl-ACP methyl ester carboxylesterase
MLLEMTLLQTPLPSPVALTVNRAGPADEGRTPMVVAHGLLGTSRNWNSFTSTWAQDRPVLCCDMRNHGTSPRDPAMGYLEMAADLAALIEAEGKPGIVLGHSMGGKAAMALALTRPLLVSALVVVDIAPLRNPGPGFVDFLDAMMAINLGGLSKRSDADAALRVAVPDPMIRGFLLQNLVRGPDGFAWAANLPVLRGSMPAILDWPEPLLGLHYAGPVLAIGGAESRYINERGSAAIRQHFPEANIKHVPGAGHWVHADQARAFGDLIAGFFQQHG